MSVDLLKCGATNITEAGASFLQLLKEMHELGKIPSLCSDRVCGSIASMVMALFIRAVVTMETKHHGLVRSSVADLMVVERAYFQLFVEGDGEAFDRYISEKRRDGSWGDEPEIQALCKLYGRAIEVYVCDAREGGGARVLTFHTTANGADVIRLSYTGDHYNSDEVMCYVRWPKRGPCIAES